MSAGDAAWHRVLGLDELPEGRVTTVTAGHRSLAMTHHEGRYGALENRCAHQGGPLGEGAIENGWLRCPWHGWDYCPITGKASGGHEDEGVATFAVEVRDDGVWVEVPPEEPHLRTVSDLMVGTCGPPASTTRASRPTPSCAAPMGVRVTRAEDR
jgi:pyruvate oxidase